MTTHSPTDPTPLGVGEAKVIRVEIQRVATTILAKITQLETSIKNMSAGMDLELSHIKLEIAGLRATVESLRDRDSDTGRHILQLAEGVGEAKGMARARRNSDPARIVGKLVTTLTVHVVEKWTIHLAWVIGGAVGGVLFGWLAHLLHWVK